MIDREQLVVRNERLTGIIRSRLTKFLLKPPNLLNEARQALKDQEAVKLEGALHDLKDVIEWAGGTGALLEVTLRALYDCGYQTGPQLPPDLAAFSACLDEIERLHSADRHDASALLQEFPE